MRPCRAARQPVYGRNTGVGANHVVELSEGDRAEHEIRLLRSHAAGTGPPPRFGIRASEALGFINSSAATLGDAALTCHDLAALLRAAVPVASWPGAGR